MVSISWKSIWALLRYGFIALKRRQAECFTSWPTKTLRERTRWSSLQSLTACLKLVDLLHASQMTTQLWPTAVLTGALRLQTDGGMDRYLLMHVSIADQWYGHTSISLHILVLPLSRVTILRMTSTCLWVTHGRSSYDKWIGSFSLQLCQVTLSDQSFKLTQRCRGLHHVLSTYKIKWHRAFPFLFRYVETKYLSQNKLKRNFPN